MNLLFFQCLFLRYLAWIGMIFIVFSPFSSIHHTSSLSTVDTASLFSPTFGLVFQVPQTRTKCPASQDYLPNTKTPRNSTDDETVDSFSPIFFPPKIGNWRDFQSPMAIFHRIVNIFFWQPRHIFLLKILTEGIIFSLIQASYLFWPFSIFIFSILRILLCDQPADSQNMVGWAFCSSVAWLSVGPQQLSCCLAAAPGRRDDRLPRHPDDVHHCDPVRQPPPRHLLSGDPTSTPGGFSNVSKKIPKIAQRVDNC